MEDCVFCQIVAGQIPCHKVWEDEDFLAFLNIHPLDVGHTLVVPKKHCRWVWDLPSPACRQASGRQEVGNFSEYFQTVKKIALLLKEKLGAEWIEMNVVGTDIPHAHVHLIPHCQKRNLIAKDFKTILEKIKN